jgi:hypothetical protein
MEQVPPDVARKLLNRDFTNLIKRVQEGGKLSKTERAMLQAMAVGSPNTASALASNFNERSEIRPRIIHGCRSEGIVHSGTERGVIVSKSPSPIRCILS